jgi:hypothetical protein
MTFRPVFASIRAVFRPVSKPALVAAVVAVGGLPAATAAFAAYGNGYGGGYSNGYSDSYRGGGSRRGGPPGRPVAGRPVTGRLVTSRSGFDTRRDPPLRGYHGPYAIRYVYRDVDGRPYYHYHYFGCYQRRWAATPWGWQLRRVNVCYSELYND